MRVTDNSNTNMDQRSSYLDIPTYTKYFGLLDPQMEALNLAVKLDEEFASELDQILEGRRQLLQRVDKGDFSDLEIMEPSVGWKPKPYTDNTYLYRDTVLEMTGNALNRMGINAFNYVNRMNQDIDPSKPRVAWMCCGEDANGAQFESICENIRHLRDLVTGEAEEVVNGKLYQLEFKNKIPPFSFRPRGLHCIDANVIRESEPISGSLLDLALWSTFVLPLLIDKFEQTKVGPLLYIPKMQLVQEAKFWHSAIKRIESIKSLPEGTIKVVFLAETFPAVFKITGMIEAFEGRCIGLNCGRWDYLFSYQSVLGHRTSVKIDGYGLSTKLPPKHMVTTQVPLLKKYQIHVARTCHLYGIQFIGGMNAQLPSSHPDPNIRQQENEQVLKQTEMNKVNERLFYGAHRTWVAHIGLLEVAKKLNQVKHNNPIDTALREEKVNRRDLVEAPSDVYTVKDFKSDLSVIVLYMAQYILNKNGAVAVNGLMEDMATAEISLTLVWYYLKHNLLNEEIKKEGGWIKILSNAALDVSNKMHESNKQNQDKSGIIASLVSLIKNILVDMLENLGVSERPSLEKLLYALSLAQEGKREDKVRAFSLLLDSQRFADNAKVASLVQSRLKTDSEILSRRHDSPSIGSLEVD